MIALPLEIRSVFGQERTLRSAQVKVNIGHQRWFGHHFFGWLTDTKQTTPSRASSTGLL